MIGFRFDGRHLTISGGRIGPSPNPLRAMGLSVVVLGDSTAEISGGTIFANANGGLQTEDSAHVDFTGGEIRLLTVTEAPPNALPPTPGPKIGILALGESVIDISGGRFERDEPIQFAPFGLAARDSATINIYGTGLSLVDDWVTGVLADGTPIELAVEGNIVLHEIAAMLQAGDADQDLDFDQFDLIQVQQAGKYATGQPATWGEGDWNGAPGGQPGAPPAGDGLFNQLDVVAAQQVALYNTGPYVALQPRGERNDAQTSVVYDAKSGELSVDAPAGLELTSINIDSVAGSFTGDPADNLGGSFDNDADNNIFKATFGSSFGSLSFGNVAQAGLTEAFVVNDLTVVGSLAGGGDLGAVDLIYIPEPSAVVLLILGMVALATRRRV